MKKPSLSAFRVAILDEDLTRLSLATALLGSLAFRLSIGGRYKIHVHPFTQQQNFYVWVRQRRKHERVLLILTDRVERVSTLKLVDHLRNKNDFQKPIIVWSDAVHARPFLRTGRATAYVPRRSRSMSPGYPRQADRSWPQILRELPKMGKVVARFIRPAA